MLTPEQIADGWIDHDGGLCPVALDSRLSYMMRDGVIWSDVAGCIIWDKSCPWSDQILAYRPETPA